MNDFSITVTGVTKPEYFQACRVTTMRLYKTLAVVMVIICAVIILATGNATPAAFLGPLVIFLIVAAFCEIGPRINYKGQLETMTPITYSFGPLGWQAQMEGQEANRFKWEATPKMVKTKSCLFLYNSDTSSNLLPTRLLTAEQISQINSWYKSSRDLAKEYEKKQMRKERREFKENHKGSIFTRRGPAWGPLRGRRNSDQDKK